MVGGAGISGALAIRRNRSRRRSSIVNSTSQLNVVKEGERSLPTTPAKVHKDSVFLSRSQQYAASSERLEKWPEAKIRGQGGPGRDFDEDPPLGVTYKIPFEELPNGKNAWKGSDLPKPTKRRIGGKNKVGDASLTPSSEKISTEKYRQSGVVNIVLYVGFALIGIGMTLTLVGLGDRGFKTKELKLVGPSLIGCGILFAILRILFCSFQWPKKQKMDEKKLLSPSSETLIGDRQSTPPTKVVKPIRLSPPPPLPPIAPKPEEVPEERRPPTSIQSTTRPLNTRQSIPNLIEDEVESDADLGLDVNYIEDEKSKKSRPNSNRSFSLLDTQISNVPTKEDASIAQTHVNQEDDEENEGPDSTSELLQLNDDFTVLKKDSSTEPLLLQEEMLETRPSEVLLDPSKLTT